MQRVGEGASGRRGSLGVRLHETLASVGWGWGTEASGRRSGSWLSTGWLDLEMRTCSRSSSWGWGELRLGGP